MDKLARYFPKVENSKSFSRKKLCQNKIGTFHLKHPVHAYRPPFNGKICKCCYYWENLRMFDLLAFLHLFLVI